jgi:3-hydroxybutyryl-CoA dehydrogenase
MAEQLENYALSKDVQTIQSGTIQKVGIVGCGVAGQEIARVISQNGIEVKFIDLTQERIDDILNEISKQIDEVISKWGLTKSDKRAILSRISGSVDYKDISDCDIVIETINTRTPGTNKEIRKDVFRKIENVVGPDTVILSNISSIMVSEIATALKRPERVLGLHFLTPATTVKVIEVVKGLRTNEESYERVVRFAKMIQKEVITLNESPGNVSTRLIVSLINEACETFIEGVASIKCIDKTMKQGFGLQFGPFELADRIGLDKILKWMDNLYAEFGEQKFKASPVIKRLVRLNYLGRKTGKGFYKYEDNKIVGVSLTTLEIN